MVDFGVGELIPGIPRGYEHLVEDPDEQNEIDE